MIIREVWLFYCTESVCLNCTQLEKCHLLGFSLAVPERQAVFPAPSNNCRQLSSPGRPGAERINRCLLPVSRYCNPRPHSLPQPLPTGPVITSPWPSLSREERGHQWHQHFFFISRRPECNVLPSPSLKIMHSSVQCPKDSRWNQTSDLLHLVFVRLYFNPLWLRSVHIILYKGSFLRRWLQPMLSFKEGRFHSNPFFCLQGKADLIPLSINI